MKKTIFFILLVFGCYGCNIEVEAPWNSTPIPVVYSILSPGEVTRVYVNQTIAKSGTLLKNPYPEARVYISGPDNNWIELPRLRPDTCVFADTLKLLKIESGKTYSLKVLLSNSTVRAQTTVPIAQTVITSASCQAIDTHTSFDYWTQKEWDVYVDILKVNYILPDNPDVDTYLWAPVYKYFRSLKLNGTSYQTKYFETPQDSTSFLLYTTTIDRYYKKYINAQSINELSSNYSENLPILVIIQTYGGVLPQFSNIENGVGLFGSSVTDSKRVEVTKPTK